MNRMEVIMTIKTIGQNFGRVMASLQGNEFAAGYNQAVNDMVEGFNAAPIYPTFNAEREAMLAHIRELTERNEALEREVCEKHATIQKLLSHVNIAEVLGVETKKQEAPKPKRRVTFLFE